MVRPRWERRVLRQPPVEDLPHPTAGIYTDRVRCWVVHNYREHLADPLGDQKYRIGPKPENDQDATKGKGDDAKE